MLFYNDIPKVLAASLFPRLLASKPRATDTTPRFLRREAVILRDLTLDEFQQLALRRLPFRYNQALEADKIHDL